jgi:hypothetical protein
LEKDLPGRTFTAIDKGDGGKWVVVETTGGVTGPAPTGPLGSTIMPKYESPMPKTPTTLGKPGGELYSAKPKGPEVRTENLPTPALARAEVITSKDADFVAKTKVMLDTAKPNEPILLGTQTTGNHLTAIRGADGKFTLIESNGKRVIRTIPDVKIDVEAIPGGTGARVKWEGGEYVAQETFPVLMPKVSPDTVLDFSKVAEKPDSARFTLNDSGMGVRFGTESPGNHVDLIRLNSDTWVARRTNDGVDQPQEVVRNVNLTGNNLAGTNVDGSPWSYSNAREFAALTSVEGGNVHQ